MGILLIGNFDDDEPVPVNCLCPRDTLIDNKTVNRKIIRQIAEPQ